jgi:hypothetical protein
MRRFLWGLLSVGLLACGNTTVAPPEDVPQASSPDAGQTPTGEEVPDAGEPDTGDVSCQPMGCPWNSECGSYSDGCGGIVHCGSCAAGEVCGALTEGRCDPCPRVEDLGESLPVHRQGRPTASAHGDETGDFHGVYRWVAPGDGTYVVDLAGSGPDVSFSLHRGHCRGEPLAGAGEGTRVARVELSRGEEVFVTLRGHGWYRSLSFHYQLHIGAWRPDEAGACGDRWDNDADGYADCFDSECEATEACRSGQACTDVELGQGLPVKYDAPGDSHQMHGPNFFSPGCAAAEYRPERVYRWTAPEYGVYVFRTYASGSSVALYSSCRSAVLACSSAIAPDYGPPDEPPPYVEWEMFAGETVLIVVEGTWWDGNPLPIPRHLSIYAPGRPTPHTP